MWIVYNRQDSPDCGWVVTCEEEAIRVCEENENLAYVYRG